MDANSEDRDRAVRRVIVVEGLANLSVIATKLWAGIATGSLAILGDAVHSLSDLLNNVLTWLVMRVSAQPADDNHPYGHRKFESLAVFVLATLLVVLAFELITTAVTRDNTPVASTPVALALMLATLVINLWLAWWQRGWARRLDADILRADASHTLSDALTTLAVIIGWQLAARGLPWLDRVAAIAVAGIVLWLALQLFRRAVPILVDEAALDANDIAALLGDVDGVLSVRRVRSRRTGMGFALDVEIGVDPNLSLAEGSQVRERALRDLIARYDDIDAIITLAPHSHT
ncbi:MAG: cation diffusion facilitator family transporter [Pseudomonadota bacterium]